MSNIPVCFFPQQDLNCLVENSKLRFFFVNVFLSDHAFFFLLPGFIQQALSTEVGEM